LITGLGLAFGVAAAPEAVLRDVLDMPTASKALPLKDATTSVARNGSRVLAVGPRGLILLSVDGAATWKQVASPVGSDLVAVKFTDALTAWAVGHDAVALRSIDGGASWTRVLDGRKVLALLRSAYVQRTASGDTAAAGLLKEVERSAAQSATPGVLPAPFLDVWFADAKEGYLVGAFGLILHTADGGDTWQPWTDRVDNERRFHLYAVGGDGARRWIAGEQGLLLRWDAGSGRFAKVETPYAGTFFGLDVQGDRIVAFGLRGNAYGRLTDTAPWKKVATGTDANLVAAVSLSADRLLLVSQAGQVLDGSLATGQASTVVEARGGEVAGAVGLDAHHLVLARIDGVATANLPQLAP
jgi:photosystem II stability/assembly factor-like uncharacterized protein